MLAVNCKRKLSRRTVNRSLHPQLGKMQFTSLMHVRWKNGISSFNYNDSCTKITTAIELVCRRLKPNTITFSQPNKFFLHIFNTINCCHYWTKFRLMYRPSPMATIHVAVLFFLSIFSSIAHDSIELN